MDAGSAAPPLDDAATAFAAVRRRLFGIAYRILGSAADAEDVVQEAWLRWQTTDRGVVRDAAAFLATTTTRLAINVAQSARVRRESYVGPWLPEPVDTSADPELGAVRGEALEIAVLLLLEKLTPTERAAYVLSEAFDEPYAAIADTLQLSEANARQLASRARKHLAAERRERVGRDAHRRLLETFVAAARSGDLAALEALLTADVVSHADGAGAPRAARKPIVGRDRVARLLAGVSGWFWADATVTPVQANGRSAMLLERDGAAFALLTIDASADGIDRVLWVMTPEKLAAFARAVRPPAPHAS
jgi:RNA polymerase sigma-70 factor (ECF subfamily)